MVTIVVVDIIIIIVVIVIIVIIIIIVVIVITGRVCISGFCYPLAQHLQTAQCDRVSLVCRPGVPEGSSIVVLLDAPMAVLVAHPQSPLRLDIPLLSGKPIHGACKLDVSHDEIATLVVETLPKA